MRRFAAAGYSVRHDPKRITGEIVVINTCGFIGAAQEESINTILAFVRAKEKGRIGKLIVMGCLSERFRGDLKTEIPEIDALYGKFDWKNLVADLGPSFAPEADTARLLTTLRLCEDFGGVRSRVLLLCHPPYHGAAKIAYHRVSCG